MARAITWQDVAAPNLGGSLAASQDASELIGRALTGLGTVGTNYMDATKEAATREAVAGIMNSVDPMAAARAAPQGWQVDPLAVQKAAQVQDQVIRQNTAADAALEASRVSTDANRAQLEDLTSTRQASTMSSKMIDQIVKTGKLPSIDLDASEWKTAAGNKAYSQTLDFWNKYQDDKRGAEALHLQRKALDKADAEKDFLGFAREFGASAEGQIADPATWDRKLTEEAKRRGVNVGLVDQGLQLAERGAQANKPTQVELDSFVPTLGDERGGKGSATFGDINSKLNIRAQDLQQQKTSAINKFDREKRGQELVAGNVFKGPPAAIPGLLATKLEWKEEDAREAIDAIKAEYKGLTDWQAADIALATQGKWFEKAAARSEQGKALAGAYTAFNDIGGTTGLATKIEEVGAPFDRALARIPVLQRQVIGSARSHNPVPQEAVDILNEYRAAEKAVRDARTKDAKALAEAQARKLKDAAEAAEKALAVPVSLY
jgi:hypothetical protein